MSSVLSILILSLLFSSAPIHRLSCPLQLHPPLQIIIMGRDRYHSHCRAPWATSRPEHDYPEHSFSSFYAPPLPVPEPPYSFGSPVFPSAHATPRGYERRERVVIIHNPGRSIALCSPPNYRRGFSFGNPTPPASTGSRHSFLDDDDNNDMALGGEPAPFASPNLSDTSHVSSHVRPISFSHLLSSSLMTPTNDQHSSLSPTSPPHTRCDASAPPPCAPKQPPSRPSPGASATRGPSATTKRCP